MKNFLIVLLMIGIVGGTIYGVKWEIDTFNEQNGNSKVVEQINEVEDIINEEENDEKLEEDDESFEDLEDDLNY